MEDNKENEDLLRGARIVIVPRQENEFGFTLRHFIVYPPKSALKDAKGGEGDGGQKAKRSKLSTFDPMDTIFVKQVKEDGPAQLAGLHTGDRILSVNGESVAGKTYSQVIALIQSSDKSLKLLVVPKDEDVLQMTYEASAYKHNKEPYRGSATDIPQPPKDVSWQDPRARQERTIRVRPASHASKFKSEVQIQPKNAPYRTSSDPSLQSMYPRAGAMAGSMQSVSSAGSGGGRIPASIADPSRPDDELRYIDDAEVESSQDSYRYNPPSSATESPHRNLPWVTGPHRAQVKDRRTGSIDSISRSSDHSSQSRGSHLSATSLRSQDSSGSGSSYSPKPKETIVEHPLIQERHSDPHTMGEYSPMQRHLVEGVQDRGRDPNRHGPAQHILYPVPAPYRSMHGSTEQGIPARTRSTSSTAVPSAFAPLGSSSVAPASDMNVNAMCSSSVVYTSLAYVPPITAWPANTVPASPSLIPVTCSANLSRSQSGDITAPTAAARFAQDASPHRRYSGQDTAWNRKYGTNVSVQMPDGAGVQINIPRAQSDSPGPGAHISISKRAVPQPDINLVAARAKKFETGSQNSLQDRYRAEYNKFAYKPGGDSVASRAAQFENRSMDSDDEPSARKDRNVRVEIIHSGPAQSPGYPVGPGLKSTENVDLRLEAPPPKTPTVRLQPSPVQDYYFDSGSDQGIVRDRSPLTSDDSSPPTPRLSGQGVSRQPSYLRAINSPRSKFLDPPAQMSPTLFTTTATTTTTTTSTTVVLRQPQQQDDQESRLQRRQSYLMATGTPDTQTRATPSPTPPPEALQVPPGLQTSQGCHIVLNRPMTVDLPVTGNFGYYTQKDENDMYRHRCYTYDSPMSRGWTNNHVSPRYGRPASVGFTAYDASKSQGMVYRPPNNHRLTSSNIGGNPPAIHVDGDGQDAITTPPTRGVSIRKLKEFFGERTPRIIEATTDKARLFDLPSPIGMGEPILEGKLNFKVAVTDGKRSSDRSWRPMWAVLRGHALYLYKEKSSAVSNPNFADEQPISIKNCVVDIAYKYTKKKNVFQLITYNGSEYLFQADEHDNMVEWIDTIRKNSNPDSDEKGVASEELILRKTSEAEGTFKLGSPQGPPKPPKKAAAKPQKMKVYTVQSPGPKQRKTSEKDITEAGKGKERTDNKTWRGRVAKKFKRYGSSSSAQPEVSGTFGVPLELCPSSSFSEMVPLVVELCTTIVEARGMETTGIYRVPGNTGSINMLQEELNKGGENVECDSDKWLDVNVVGSLLKSFFRKLPEPLVTEELYDQFITANRDENPEKRMLKIKKLLHDLPEHHFETFQYLATHLNKVASMENVNKMDCRNLAIVFGPTLVRTTDDSMVTMVKDMSDQCRIVESIILHPDWFFGSWDIDSWVPVDEDPADGAPISGMNKALLNKAERLEGGDKKDMSAKELVSSIIYAANKKRKRKDKYKSGDTSVEADMPSDGGYNERNIDHEISIRKAKEPVTPTIKETFEESKSCVQQAAPSPTPVTSSSHKTATTRDGIYSARMVFLMNNNQEPRGASLPPDNQDVEVKKYPAYEQQATSTYSTENTKPSTVHHRRYSEDMLGESGKGTMLGMNRSGPPWPQGGLHRSKTETGPHRHGDTIQSSTPHGDKRPQLQYPGWSPDKSQSRDTSSDDVLMRSMESGSSITSGRSPELVHRTDTMSTTSDYSTMSSRNSSQDTRHPLQSVPSTSTTSSTSIQLSGANLRPSRHAIPKSQSAEWRKCTISEGGKYFVMSSAGDGPSKYIAKDDSELYRGQKFDTHKISGKGTLQRRRDKGKGDDSELEQRELLRRSVSLDSLLDQAQEQGVVSPLPGSAGKSSADEEDLVTSMTATFDEKLKFLMDSSSSSTEPPQVERCTSMPTQMTMSDNVLVMSDQNAKYGATSRERGRRTVHIEEPSVSIVPRYERRTSDSQVLTLHRVASDPHELKEMEYAAELRKNTEKMFGSREMLDSSERLVETPVQKKKTSFVEAKAKAASASPPVMRKRKERKERRRHTVGGTKDLEHFKAVMTLNQPVLLTERKTAWERLKPAVKGDTKNVQEWLQERRLHTAGSSPALLTPSLGHMSPGLKEGAGYHLGHEGSMTSRDVVRARQASSEPASPGAFSRVQKSDDFSFESSI